LLIEDPRYDHSSHVAISPLEKVATTNLILVGSIRNQQSQINNILCFQLTIDFMPDPAEQLQRIYLAGFEFQTFDRYPKCVGVIRDGCIALLIPGVDGMQMMGTPGWRMGEVMGVLVEREGRQVFQAKQEILEATPERLDALNRFRHDLNTLLHSSEQ
jgi:hypothetical protein